jgi:hypothetical protein
MTANTLTDGPPTDPDAPAPLPVACLMSIGDLKMFRAVYSARFLNGDHLTPDERAHWAGVEEAHAEYLDAIRLTVARRGL